MLQYPKQRKPRASGSERKSVSSHILREFPYAAPWFSIIFVWTVISNCPISIQRCQPQSHQNKNKKLKNTAEEKLVQQAAAATGDVATRNGLLSCVW